MLETALEKNRDRRYKTALDFAEDLRRCREFEPIHARPVGRLLRARRWAQRHPALAVAVALLSVGLVASLLALARISDELRTQTMLNLVTESRQQLSVDSVRALELALQAHELSPNAKATISQLHRALTHGVPIASVPGGVQSFGFWSSELAE